MCWPQTLSTAVWHCLPFLLLALYCDSRIVGQLMTYLLCRKLGKCTKVFADHSDCFSVSALTATSGHHVLVRFEFSFLLLHPSSSAVRRCPSSLARIFAHWRLFISLHPRSFKTDMTFSKCLFDSVCHNRVWWCGCSTSYTLEIVVGHPNNDDFPCDGLRYYSHFSPWPRVGVAQNRPKSE